MYAPQVGQPYSSTRHVWPEGADFNYRDGGHELRLFLRDASHAQIAAIGSGPVEFGFFAEPLGLVLIVRFSAQLSFDCSFCWRRVSPDERVIVPPVEEVRHEARALISIILVEA